MANVDLVIIVLAIFGANGLAWAAIRTELRWLRRDVDALDKKLQKHLDTAHGGN